MPLPEEIDAVMPGEFEIEMFQAPAEETMQCCFGCFCPCCAVYHQRERLLAVTGEEYVCCAGMCPILCLKDPLPKVPVLCIESFCCSWWALSGNRFMVQTRFGKRNTACDNRILCCMCLVNIITCIASCFVEIPQEISACVELMNCSVFGCMHGQQSREVDNVEKKGYRKPGNEVMGVLPPEQQKMISDSRPVKPMTQAPQQVPAKPVQSRRAPKGKGKPHDTRH